MRVKTEKLIITFSTTVNAMEMEQLCRDHHAPGRLIPVPREITAGCGLAWCAEKEEKERLLSLCRTAGLSPEAVHVCMV